MCCNATRKKCVFIDDRAENVAAATSLGIHGIRYEGSGQLAEELSRPAFLWQRSIFAG